jgi:serine/threonine protein kinase
MVMSNDSGRQASGGPAPLPSTQPHPDGGDFHEKPTLAAAATLAGGAGVAAPAGLPPELIDHPRYRVLRLLGTGGMGAVYQAEHRVMERLVALKVIRADFTADVAAVDRFHREVRAAAALSHPNIVTAFDAEQIGNVHFLVMEYVEGVNLARHVALSGPLPVDEACSHIRQAALGLHHAYEKGMIHRDIKPHNLMLTHTGSAPKTEPYGRVKILDFGLARLAGAPVQNAQTVSGMLLGTVDFMAPEQADDARTVDIRADIYSLGCTLYYLLSGRVLFPDGSLLQKVVAMMEKPPPPLSQYRIDLPPLLFNVIGRMLAKTPENRYQTPAEVAHVLTPFLSGPSLSVPVTEPYIPRLEEHVPVATLIEEVEPAVPLLEPTDPPRRASATEVLPRSPQTEPRRTRSRWRLYAIGAILIGVFLFGGTGWMGYKGITGLLDRFSNKPRSNWENVNRTWKPPPANASMDQLFPSSIGTYKRQNTSDAANIPLLGITTKGHRAQYKDFWKMEVCAYRVDESEKQKIYDGALTKLRGGTTKDNDFGRNTVSYTGAASGSGLLLVYEFHSFNLNNIPSDLPRGAMWYKDGWLFVLQADNMAPDPEQMLLKYLEK